jgi:primary-amine oxidase
MTLPRTVAALLVTVMSYLFSAPASAAEHPLEPLSAAELQSAYEIVLAYFRTDTALPDEPLRFPIAVLSEPSKEFVLGWSGGKRIPRLAEVHVLHYPSNRSWQVFVDLRRKRVKELKELAAGTQPAVTTEEYVAASDAVHAHEPWKAALRARGVDPDLAYVDVWAPGDEPLPDDIAAQLPYGHDTRLLRCLAFDRGAPIEDLDPAAPQNPYDRPVEGVVVTVDMNSRKVVHMTDTIKPPVPVEGGNAMSMRAVKPLVVSQPNGSGIELKGRLVRWQNWQFYVALHPREGLVLYDVRYHDHGTLRPVAYRLALSEIYVPYGLGESNWIWRSAFDVGEYNCGTLAQPLEVDRDIPENAITMDAVFYSDLGPAADNPSGTVEFPDTVALYERDSGILWTRTDPTTVDRDTRYGRELVVTWNAWIGNYIYGFDWIFKLDGSIEVKVNLTGTTLNRGTTEAPEASAPKVGKDGKGIYIGAANHQHFLNFRLDLDVDGRANHVMEMEVANLPNTGFKNSFDAVTTDLHMEGFRDVNPFTARHWHVMGAMMNAVGKHTSFAIEPAAFAIPYSAPDFPGLERAQFAAHQLWLTRYQDKEQYAAGPFPNQGKAPDGLVRYVDPPEMLSEDDDVVVWYTTGFTHIAKPEDFPTMSTESIGFRLAPRGFFDRNPALDVADQGAP